jgi:thiosulfate reductase cytochrome b subunit
MPILDFWTKWLEHHSQACVFAYQTYHGSMPLMRTGFSGNLQVSDNLSRKIRRYLPIEDSTQEIFSQTNKTIYYLVVLLLVLLVIIGCDVIHLLITVTRRRSPERNLLNLAETSG